MNTKELNKLIAEFMGLEFVLGGSQNEKKTNQVSELRCAYHSSWEWLMPVVMKLQGIHRY